MNIPELFLNQARMDFGIFVEDMIQRIYENFVGILWKAEIQVASQPKANRLIPLIEKGIFPRNKYWVLAKMEMTWPWDRFENDKPLGSGRREDLPRFQDHIATEKKELQIKIRSNPKEKERAKNRGVTCRVENMPDMM